MAFLVLTTYEPDLARHASALCVTTDDEGQTGKMRPAQDEHPALEPDRLGGDRGAERCGHRLVYTPLRLAGGTTPLRRKYTAI